jgi:hypothetical protein
MNLAILKETLVKKPIANPNEDIKIVIAKKSGEQKTQVNQTKLSLDMDNGQKAKDALELMRQRKLFGVSDKFPEQKVMEQQAPEIDIIKPSKIKKLTGRKVGLIEEPEEVVLTEVETVPVLGEQGLELDLELGEKTTRKPRVRPTRIPTDVKPLGHESMITIGDTSLPKRLPPPVEHNLIEPSYFMNNREMFVNFINGVFDTYRADMLDESKNITCEDIGKDTGEIGLLTHQKLVKDYINLYTPYRGLLLYHGLGSGKTCSSIAIAEGIKSGGKQVIIMTPASLQRNYLEEIKKCGDLIYRKNQFWEWISVEENPEYTNALATVLGFKSTDYITRKRGAWLTNVTKPNNYSDLSTTDKKSLNDQLDEMIRQKYRFINYNGLRRNSFKELTNDFEVNIFDNSVVVIDEAHNLISRIVNKINKKKTFGKINTNTLAAEPLAIQIYDYLMRANNCRVVLLTGTPIINYPNEIGVLFNILRGYIKTWHLPLNIETGSKVSRETLQQLFSNDKIMDYIDYSASSKKMVITRNPFGFESVIRERTGYEGVTTDKGSRVVNERGTMSDENFIREVDRRLNTKGISINKTGVEFHVNKALPDGFDEFVDIFIDKSTGNIINIEKFKRRIIGLTSYFRSAQEELLPKYDKKFDKHEIFIPMSDYQFKKYEEYRHEERKSESKTKSKSEVVDKNGTFKEPTSTYRIFSRLACNFVMPMPPGRPIPKLFKKTTALTVKYGPEGEVAEVKEVNYKGDTVIAEPVIAEPAIAPAINKKELERNQKALAKSQQALAKSQQALAKAQQASEKDALRALKEKEKADNALLKEQMKEQMKEQKEQEKLRKKEEEKRQKEEEKLRKKEEEKQQKALNKLAKKGGAISVSDSISVFDSESDSESDLSDSESDSDLSDSDLSDSDSGSDSESDLESDGEGRGKGDKKGLEEDEDDVPVALEGYKDIDANLRDKEELEGDEILASMGDSDYKTAIVQAYDYLKKYKSQYLVPGKLETYSPKFLAMLDNIDSPDYRGLHLVYSQFRSMEGIGIFALVLEANGFSQFKIKKTGTDSWELNMSEEEMGKPTYALYTGTEDAEEREIIRNIYNGMWDNIPNNIAAQLRRKSADNNLGEIIKVLMITSAGSEGINLRNTRYVHIMEPYWHPVRSEQVIGRARRICSHKDLPLELQTVEVFVYVMQFTQAQLDSEFAMELRIKAQDKSKLAPYPVQTSDQKLYEISNIKEQLSAQLLKGIKEASIDCATYTKSNTKEGLVCMSFNNAKAADFSYNPNYAQDQNDTVAAINRTTIEWDAREFIVSPLEKYILRMDTNQLYDYDNVKDVMANPAIQLKPPIGKLVKKRDGNYEVIKNK